jgi:rhamnosyltransferase
MKLAAVVVLYNPNDEILKNINSYIDYVDIVYAVDNSSADNSANLKSDKIVYLANVIDNILTDGDEDLEYKDSILEDFGLNDSVKFEQVVADLRK